MARESLESNGKGQGTEKIKGTRGVGRGARDVDVNRRERGRGRGREDE